MKYGQATEKQKTFIREYVSSGDALESARAAGYSDRSLPSLRAEASRLKRRHASQIADELRLNIINSLPRVLAILRDLALNADSEHVRMKASMDILDRAGFKPIKRQETHHVSRTVEEVEAELMGLVGRELGELLLGKKKPTVVN